MDLLCTASTFLKATIVIAIGNDYVKIDSIDSFVPSKNEKYIYCDQINGKSIEFDIKNGILILTPDIIKSHVQGTQKSPKLFSVERYHDGMPNEDKL